MNSTILPNLLSIYFVLAVGYNFVSIALAKFKGKAAGPGEPMAGITFMAILYLIYASGPLLSEWLYSFFVASFAVLILVYGIIRHVINPDKNVYFSEITRHAAWMINVFGFSLLLLILFTHI